MAYSLPPFVTIRNLLIHTPVSEFDSRLQPLCLHEFLQHRSDFTLAVAKFMTLVL